jgi:RNA 3'-terminal phosphate cyclase
MFFNFNFFYIFTGEKGIPAEKVAQEAVQSLITDIESQGCVDQYMQDQLVKLKI